MSIIYFLIVLSVLVMIHEFGHFIVAKKTGVRVEKFSFGFGPKLFSIKKGDTDMRSRRRRMECQSPRWLFSVVCTLVGAATMEI